MKPELTITSPNSKSEIFVFKTSVQLVGKNKSEIQGAAVVNFLKSHLGIENLSIEHDTNGAPFIRPDSETNISISHSGKWLVVQLAKCNPVGVDIQIVQKDLHKGRSYFINETEEENYELTERNLYLIWSAKEAVYKSRKGIIQNYKNSMIVESIGDRSLEVYVEGEKVKCSYLFKEDYLLLYLD